MRARKWTMVAPVSGGNEVTLVCDYPTPQAWKNPPAEVEAYQANHWEPDTRSLMAVAETPKKRSGEPATEIIKIRTLGDMVAAVLGVSVDELAKPGNYDIVPTRPEGSIRRLNIIGHGKDSLVGLSGEIVYLAGKQPSVVFDDELAPSVYGTAQLDGRTETGEWRYGGHNENKKFFQSRRSVLDASQLGGVAIDWLMGPLVDQHGNLTNSLHHAVDGSEGYSQRALGETDPDHYDEDQWHEIEERYEGVRRFGRFVRDLMRTRFHLQGQIALVTCNTGAIATFAHDLSMVFNTRVLAFRKKVLYKCEFEDRRIIKRGLTKYDPDLEEQKPISDGDAAWEPEPEPEVKKSPEEEGYFPGYMIHAVTRHWVPSDASGAHLQFDRAVPKPPSLGPVLYSHVEPTQLRLQVLGGRRGIFEVEVNMVDEQGNPPTVYDEEGRVEVVLGGEYDPASGQGVELLGESQWRFEAKNRGHHSLKARAHRIPSFQLRATSGKLVGISKVTEAKSASPRPIRFEITISPSDRVVRGKPFEIHVKAINADGSPKADFEGEIVLKVSRERNMLRHFVPRLVHRFTAADQGEHTFKARLRVQGEHSIDILGEGLREPGRKVLRVIVEKPT